MRVDRETLTENYASRTDEELLELRATGTLTELAIEVLESEIRARKIEVANLDQPETIPPAGTPPQADQSLTEEHFTRLVKRLEGVAERNPSMYKMQVILLACLGYLYIFFVVAVLVGTMAFLGFILAGAASFAIVLAKLGLKLGIPLLALLAIVARSLWVRLEAPGGIRLRRKDCPELFQLLAKIRKRLKGPRTHAVLLNADFNASIVQIPRLGLLGWQKNYLLFGLPLMQALSPEQFTAVLGHEYGHLSGAHGKLGAWVYRIRVTWYQLMEALDQEEHWGRFVFQRFFHWYAPFFSAYSFVLARSNEYQADRCATELTGVSIAAQALVNTELRGAYLANEFWPAFYRQADRLPQPPATVYKKMWQALRDPPPDEQNAWLEQALRVETGLDDTHPSLSDRLAALNAKPDIPPTTATSAAERFLGSTFEPLQQTLDDVWRKEMKAWWTERYQYVQSARAESEEFKVKSDADQLTAEEAWEYGLLLRDLDGEDVALPLFRKVFALDPTNSGARFLAGQAMLHNGDEGGVSLVEEAMERDFDFILPGSQVVYEYLCEHGREQEATRYYEWAEQHRELIEKAREERSHLPFDSEYRRPKLTEDERTKLVAQFKEFPTVVRVYVVRRVVQYLSEYPFYVVGMVIDPAVGGICNAKEIANRIRFPHDVTFLSLTGPNRPMREIMEAVTDSSLF